MEIEEKEVFVEENIVSLMLKWLMVSVVVTVMIGATMAEVVGAQTAEREGFDAATVLVLVLLLVVVMSWVVLLVLVLVLVLVLALELGFGSLHLAQHLAEFVVIVVCSELCIDQSHSCSTLTLNHFLSCFVCLCCLCCGLLVVGCFVCCLLVVLFVV